MKKNVALGLVAAAGLTSTVSTAMAQAPLTAQRWETRFLVSNAGPNSTVVRITLQARVGIIPTTFSGGTNNFGISRFGGQSAGTGAFRMTFLDQVSQGLGLNQGVLDRGLTGEVARAGLANAGQPILDEPATVTSTTTGVDSSTRAPEPLRGLYSSFRTTFDTDGGAGSNFRASSNGRIGSGTGTTDADGLPGGSTVNIAGARTITDILGGRTSQTTTSQGIGTDGSSLIPVGVATLNGQGGFAEPSVVVTDAFGNVAPGAGDTDEFADIYSFEYFPREDLVNPPRTVQVIVQNINGRYLFNQAGSSASASTANYYIGSGATNGSIVGSGTGATTATLTFSFVVPTPGAAALLGLGGLVAARRRRA